MKKHRCEIILEIKRWFDAWKMDFNISMLNDWNCGKKSPKIAYPENYLTY